MAMHKVRCNKQPLGDIRARQPKSPGQKASTEPTIKQGKPPEYRFRDPEIVWANKTKTGWRCTYCGHVGHELA